MASVLVDNLSTCITPRVMLHSSLPKSCFSVRMRRRSGFRQAPWVRDCLSTAVARDNGTTAIGRSGESISGRNAYLPPWFSVAPMMDWTDNHYRTLARLISKRAWLYTEMVVADTINHQQDNLDKFLKFPETQHPIVLQLGGSSPEKLMKAAQLASNYNYDEINLKFNLRSVGWSHRRSFSHAGVRCFCKVVSNTPASRLEVVGVWLSTAAAFLSIIIVLSSRSAYHGFFQLVGQSMAALAEGSPGVPVTVKCRIGVDDFDSYELLYNFIATVSSLSPTQHFIIHSRKAILKGLSPAANRTIPPLKYEYIYALIRDFQNLKFTLNGGIVSVHQVREGLQMGAYGVMLGRAAYNSPWATLGNVDTIVYGETASGLTRRQILEAYVEYADAELHKYGQKKPSVRHLVKPLLHLFHSEASAGLWRRAIDESLRHCETVCELLKKTLPVLPDCVLDAPPPLENHSQPIFADLSQLPHAPLGYPSILNRSEVSPCSFSDENLVSCEHA